MLQLFQYICISFLFLVACSNTNKSSSSEFPEIMYTYYLTDIDISKDSLALTAQTLVKEIWTATYGQDTSAQVLKSQWQSFRPDSSKAQKAIQLLQKSLAQTNYAHTSIEYAYILKLTAYAYHFSQENYSYMKKLPEAYQQSQQYMTKALQLAKDMPKLVAKWHLEAANLAAPKIYFGFKAPSVIQADLIVEKHLRKAVEYYKKNNNTDQELRIWKLFDWYNASAAFDYHQYYKRLVELHHIENSKSPVVAAIAVSQWTKHTLGPYRRDTLDDQQITEVLAAAQKALKTFHNNNLDQTGQAWAYNLMTDLAYYYKYSQQDFEKAIDYNQQALDFAQQHELSFLSAAKSLAATYLELKQWTQTLAIYEKTLAHCPKLAHIDYEHIHFSIGLVYFYEQNKTTALAYWQKNLSNQKIMNGVSAYTWYFVDPTFKKQLKKDVLTLAKAINYQHLINIVNNSWTID